MMQRLGRVFLTLTLLTIPFQLGKHFWPPFSYVWGLPIDYLAPTVYLNDIFLLIAVFIFLVWPKTQKKNFLNKWLVALVVLAGLNILMAASRPVALWGWLKLVRVGIIAWLVSQEKTWVKKQLSRIIGFWLLIQSFFVFGQFLKQASINSLGWWLGERSFNLTTPGIAKIVFRNGVWLRAYGTFSHPNSLAGFCLLSLFLFFNTFSKKNKSWWPEIVLVAGGICLLLTFSRTAWLVGLLLLLLSRVRKKAIWQQALAFGSLVFLPFIFLRFFPNPLAIQERYLLAQAAWDSFLKHPLIGVGWDNFLADLPNFWVFTNQAKIIIQPVHNLFLLVLSQTGILGLAFCLGILKKAISPKTIIWWLVIILTGMVDHYWLTLNQNLLLLGVVLGLSF